MWPKKGQIEILTALIKSEIPKLDEVKPDAHPELKRICDKATSKRPDDRYATANEMRRDLEAYLESQNERMTVREISQIIGGLFEEQRKQTRALLEKCIAEAKEGAPISKLPSLAPPPIETTTPRPIEHTMQMLTRSVNGNVPSVVESRPSVSVVDTMTSGTPVSQATPDGSAFSLVQHAAQTKNEKQRNRMLLLVAAGLVFVSILATVLVIGVRGDTHQAPPANAAVAPPTVTAASTPTVTATVGPKATETPEEAAGAKTAASARAASSAAALAAQQPKTRIVYVPVPAPRPAAAAPPAPAAPEKPAEKPSAPSKSDCSPPFYFEGSKKVFKPGCL
jgi:serine/threonine-protein kinase